MAELIDFLRNTMQRFQTVAISNERNAGITSAFARWTPLEPGKSVLSIFSYFREICPEFSKSWRVHWYPLYDSRGLSRRENERMPEQWEAENGEETKTMQSGGMHLPASPQLTVMARVLSRLRFDLVVPLPGI